METQPLTRPPVSLRRTRLVGPVALSFRGARILPKLVVLCGAIYVLATGWGMFNLSFDIWGAFIVAPVLAGVGVLGLRRFLTGGQRALLPIAIIALFAKLAGAMVRYWVAFDAYGGASDSSSYHAAGSLLARQVREGRISIVELIPSELGTRFIDHLTGIIYVAFGSGRLSGFLMFSFMSFWGLVLFVKAAIVGIPGLAQRRYAALCMLAPSVLFWPSSIGKEAWMCLCLGLASWGGSHVVIGQWRGRTLAGLILGITGAGFVRPHLAALWAAGIAAGLLAGMLTGRSGRGTRQRVTGVLLLGVAFVGVFAVGTVAAKYLNPDPEETSVSGQVDAIQAETSRRSTGGGSEFVPIPISSPLDWPYVIERTLLRPTPFEINSVATALPGFESAILVGILLLGWRRLLSLPRMLVRSPYLLASLITVFGFGLAFSTLGNLGILVRQRSLIYPLMLLIWALPIYRRAASRRPAVTPLREVEFSW